MADQAKSPPPLSPHRQRKRERKVQEILDSAREIMRAEGVAALSMQELARRLNLRAPSLYNYFSSKLDLYDALFRLGFSLYEKHMQNTFQGELTWQENLRMAFEGYLTFAQQNPELYQLCFERPVPGFVPSEESLQLSFGILARVNQRVEDLRAEMLTDLPTGKLVDLVIAMIHGITALHLANEPYLPMGEGRFGGLIPAALELLEQAWSKQELESDR